MYDLFTTPTISKRGVPGLRRLLQHDNEMMLNNANYPEGTIYMRMHFLAVDIQNASPALLLRAATDSHIIITDMGREKYNAPAVKTIQSCYHLQATATSLVMNQHPCACDNCINDILLDDGVQLQHCLCLDFRGPSESELLRELLRRSEEVKEYELSCNSFLRLLLSSTTHCR